MKINFIILSYREGRYPVSLGFQNRWIPAFAGMTEIFKSIKRSDFDEIF